MEVNMKKQILDLFNKELAKAGHPLLSENYTLSELRESYYFLAKIYHSDSNYDNAKSDEEKMKEINSWKDFLKKSVDITDTNNFENDNGFTASDDDPDDKWSYYTRSSYSRENFEETRNKYINILDSFHCSNPDVVATTIFFSFDSGQTLAEYYEESIEHYKNVMFDVSCVATEDITNLYNAFIQNLKPIYEKLQEFFFEENYIPKKIPYTFNYEVSLGDFYKQLNEVRDKFSLKAKITQECEVYKSQKYYKALIPSIEKAISKANKRLKTYSSDIMKNINEPKPAIRNSAIRNIKYTNFNSIISDLHEEIKNYFNSYYDLEKTIDSLKLRVNMNSALFSLLNDISNDYYNASTSLEDIESRLDELTSRVNMEMSKPLIAKAMTFLSVNHNENFNDSSGLMERDFKSTNRLIEQAISDLKFNFCFAKSNEEMQKKFDEFQNTKIKEIYLSLARVFCLSNKIDFALVQELLDFNCNLDIFFKQLLNLKNNQDLLSSDIPKRK